MNWFRSDGAFPRRLGKGILIVLIGIPLWITIVRYSAWKMAAFLFFWIMCPGILVDKYILGQEQEDFLMSALSVFFMGMALLFVEWFVLYVAGLRKLVVFINPCCTIGFLVWYSVKRNRRSFPVEGRRQSIMPFLVMTLAAVYLCAYCLNFNMPRAADIRSVDCTWQIGNINQLASDFPFRDIRVAGVKARYHFFATLFLAIAKYIFGGEGWVYFTQYQIWFLPFVIAISFWELYGRVVQNKFFVAVLSAATMIGFTVNSGIWNYHMFSNVNGAGLGIPCLILLFLNLRKAESFFSGEHKPGKEHFLWTVQQILFLFVLTGLKGPFAILYVLSVCVWTGVRCAGRKVRGGGPVAFAMINVLVFAVMYRVLFLAGTQGYFSDWGIDSILQSALDVKEVAGLYEKSGVYGIWGRALFLLPSLLATFTVLLPFGLPAAVDLVRFLLGKKDLRDDLVFAGILAGGGLCAYYLFHVSGNSQAYFLFAAMPFVCYLCFDKAFALIKRNVYRNVFCVAVVVFTIFQMNGIRMTTVFPERMVCFMKGSYPETDPQRALKFEAYDFLRDHTDRNAMVATNYYGAGTFHEISAFGERRCYLEGYEYSIRNFGFDQAEERLQEMNRLFDSDWNDRDRYGFCEAFGINYLVCFKEACDAADQPLKLSEPFRTVYENEAVLIYGMEGQQ